MFAGVSVDLNNPCVGSFFLSNLLKNGWFLEKIDSNIVVVCWFAVRWRMQSYWSAFTKSTCPCTKTWMRSRKCLPKIVEMNLQPWRRKTLSNWKQISRKATVIRVSETGSWHWFKLWEYDLIDILTSPARHVCQHYDSLVVDGDRNRMPFSSPLIN